MLLSNLLLLLALNAGPIDTASLLDQCTRIADPDLRLSCYDGVARQLVTPPVESLDHLQKKPAPELLQSELRVDRDRHDYSLSVQDFLNLIQSARLEDGSEIQVLGWEKAGRQYALWLDLRGGTRLLFDFYKGAGANISVLAPVNTESGVVDPDIFIMSIASMTPD